MFAWEMQVQILILVCFNLWWVEKSGIDFLYDRSPWNSLTPHLVFFVDMDCFLSYSSLSSSSLTVLNLFLLSDLGGWKLTRSPMGEGLLHSKSSGGQSTMGEGLLYDTGTLDYLYFRSYHNICNKLWLLSCFCVIYFNMSHVKKDIRL